MMGGIGIAELIVIFLILVIVALPLAIIVFFVRKQRQSQAAAQLTCYRCKSPLASPTAVCQGCSHI